MCPVINDWIKRTGLYNIRIDKDGGLEKYGPAETGAKYLLLHGTGSLVTKDIWKIIGAAPIIMSKEELIAMDYPTNPSRDYYLVYSIEPIKDLDFDGSYWDIHKLRNTSGYGFTIPFAVTFPEFTQAKVVAQ